MGSIEDQAKGGMDIGQGRLYQSKTEETGTNAAGAGI